MVIVLSLGIKLSTMPLRNRVTTVANGVLAVSRPRKETPTRDDVAVKIDRTIHRLAGAVAAYRGVSLAEYLSVLLGPIVTKDFYDLPKEHKSEVGKG
jgi:hypothetical protein